MPAAAAGVAAGESPASSAAATVAVSGRVRRNAAVPTAPTAQTRSSVRCSGSLAIAPQVDSPIRTPKPSTSADVLGPRLSTRPR